MELGPDVEQVAAGLRVSIGLLLRQLRQAPVPGELTLPEISALVRLDRDGPSTSADLARDEQISPQSMGATLAALQERDLIRRAADARDGRRVILSVTDAGREILQSKRDARVQQLARALAREFTPAEVAQLEGLAPLLERLAASV